jgi:flagellar basal body-associated protein FliL
MKRYLVKAAIFLGITVLQLALVYVVLRLFVFSSPVESSTKEETKDTPVSQDSIVTESTQSPIDQLLRQEDEEEKIDLKKLDKKMLLQMDNLVINPSDTRGKKFLVISLAIYLNSTIITEPGTPEEIAVKDAIISLLARKSLYWIINIDNRPILREELRTTVQEVLKETKPPKIFITKFVLQ